MSKIREYTIESLEPADLEQIRSTLAHGSAGIGSISLSDPHRLIVEVADDATGEFVDRYLEGMVTGARRRRPRILFESKPSGPFPSDIDHQLLASGELLPLGEGLFGIRGRTLQLCRFFEQEFRAIAFRHHAEENRYPVLLPMEILEEVSYLAHFPQHATLCCHFPESLPVLDEIAESVERSGGRLNDEQRSRALPPTHVLQPAVCLPCYRQHRNRVIPDGRCLSLTVENQVFRFEARNFRSLARLWNFHVRDLVFLGNRTDLVQLRRKVMEDTSELVCRLDLGARIEIANDPFFTSSSRGKTVHQHLQEAKYELGLICPGDSTRVAAASFNLHGDFYSRVYNIRFASGDLVETACMGFGVERWVYGFLAQKGFDEERWPEPVLDFLNGQEATR